MSNFYCIWVRTGFEKKFIEKVQAVFDSFPEERMANYIVLESR